MRVWEMVSGETLFPLPPRRSWEQGAALSPDGRLIAIDLVRPGEDADPSTFCLWRQRRTLLALPLLLWVLAHCNQM